jgi:hypothetical protein
MHSVGRAHRQQTDAQSLTYSKQCEGYSRMVLVLTYWEGQDSMRLYVLGASTRGLLIRKGTMRQYLQQRRAHSGSRCAGCAASVDPRAQGVGLVPQLQARSTRLVLADGQGLRPSVALPSTHTRTHTHACARIHAHTHIHTLTHTHARAHSRTYTHTRTLARTQVCTHLRQPKCIGRC